MNYRILRIAPMHYESSIRNLYQKTDDLRKLPYIQQQQAIFDNGCVYSDTFSRAMQDLGHDAREIVYDIEILQKTWAAENQIKFSAENWREEILMAQIAAIKPDILYLQDVHSMSYEARRQLKIRFPFLKAVVLYKGFPGNFHQLDDIDMVFTGTPVLVRIFKNHGVPTTPVYHSFNYRVLERLDITPGDNVEKIHDFVFSGSSGYGYGGHRRRYWMLVELIRRTQLKLWVDDRKGGQVDGLEKLHPIVREFLEKDPACADLGPLPPSPLAERFPDRCFPPVFGLDMYRLLRSAKVVLHIEADAAMGAVGSIRLFEATGVGACLVTSAGSNLTDIFEPEKEVVTFTNLEECMEKVSYLLNNEDRRVAIAEAGQRRTLHDHTMSNRCARIDEVLQRLLR